LTTTQKQKNKVSKQIRRVSGKTFSLSLSLFPIPSYQNINLILLFVSKKQYTNRSYGDKLVKYISLSLSLFFFGIIYLKA